MAPVSLVSLKVRLARFTTAVLQAAVNGEDQCGVLEHIGIADFGSEFDFQTDARRQFAWAEVGGAAARRRTARHSGGNIKHCKFDFADIGDHHFALAPWALELIIAQLVERVQFRLQPGGDIDFVRSGLVDLADQHALVPVGYVFDETVAHVDTDGAAIFSGGRGEGQRPEIGRQIEGALVEKGLARCGKRRPE